MGRIARVESFTRDGANADVKVDPGGGALVTAEHCEPAGDDSQPLPGDDAVLLPCSGTGQELALAYCDPVAANRKAAAGEKRIYSRSSSGEAVAEVYCKADGTVVIAVLKSGGAPIEIRSEGPITVNSPDVRLGSGGRQVACLGDIVAGTVHALSASPGSPIVVNPAPVPGAGVPFVGKIASGVSGVKASNGTGT